MAATTFAAMIDRNAALVRKPLSFAIFMAPYATTLPSTLTTGASSLPEALPAGYIDVGLLDKDAGASWTRDINNSDVTSVGQVEPSRRDIVSDITGLTFTAQESKKINMELAFNVSLTAVSGDATTGEVAFNQANQPTTTYYRLFAIAADGQGTDAVYFARSLPRVTVTEVAEQAWKDDEALTYGITVTAFTDPVTGYSVRHFWGGPGWKAHLGATDSGFVSA
jgi:hypothetical protein